MNCHTLYLVDGNGAGWEASENGELVLLQPKEI
jgi:hypothetical protein